VTGDYPSSMITGQLLVGNSNSSPFKGRELAYAPNEELAWSPKRLYSQRFRCCDLMTVRSAVGAASCRDWRAVAAGCRSYKDEVFNP
jgi:hypothetical protein